MLRDTILRLRPVLDMLERFNNPELYKDDDRPDLPIKPVIVFQGEPDVNNPYWLVVVSAGNNTFTSSIRLRVHAQTRRIEQDLNNDSNWRVLTPGP
jgi:hypothetical protein